MTVPKWQYAYVEESLDGVEIHQRTWFDDLGDAIELMVAREPGEQLVGRLVRRRVYEPGGWAMSAARLAR